MDLRIKGQSILGLLRHAKDILFNNTGTTLTSTNVEDAIKEINSNLTAITTLKSLSLYRGYIKLYRIGNTVLCVCDGGMYDVPTNNSYLRDTSSTIIDGIPTGYRPCVGSQNVQIWDTNEQIRLVLANGVDGWRFRGPVAFTSKNLRFTSVWLTVDNLP